MKRTLLLTLWPLCVPLNGSGFADDVLTLKDGRTVPGLVESGTKEEIHIKIGGNSQAFAVDLIQSIRFDHGITLPTGTEISARTIDAIDSKKADTSREYAASLDDPIVINSVEVVPANAKAFLRLTEVKNKKVGHSSVSIALIAVMIHDHRVEVTTGSVDSQSGSKAKRTAIGAGGGAAVGAGIGALAGGPIGAAIGAGAGAAAGAAGGILTGKGVEIKSETRFTYKLTQPVALNSQTSPALPLSPPADTLTLADGTSVAGSWVSADSEKISVLINSQPATQLRSNVLAITFGPPVEPAKALDAPPLPDGSSTTVSLGQAIDQVVKILGEPTTKVDLGSKKIYTYPKLKVTFVDGKVTDVQ